MKQQQSLASNSAKKRRIITSIALLIGGIGIGIGIGYGVNSCSSTIPNHGPQPFMECDLSDDAYIVSNNKLIGFDATKISNDVNTMIFRNDITSIIESLLIPDILYSQVSTIDFNNISSLNESIDAGAINYKLFTNLQTIHLKNNVLADRGSGRNDLSGFFNSSISTIKLGDIANFNGYYFNALPKLKNIELDEGVTSISLSAIINLFYPAIGCNKGKATFD